MIELSDNQKVALEAMMDWFLNGDKQIFVLCGFAGCIDKESLIHTSHGTIPLKDIIGDLDFTGMKKLNNHIDVLTHKNNFKKVTHVHATEENTVGYEIKTESSFSLKGSYKHPVLTISNNSFIWKKFEDIEIND